AARCGICSHSAATTAAIAANAASAYSPPAKLPLAWRAQPTTDGPKNPPRLPMELIQASPVAAAVPVSSIGGIAQKGPLVPYNPIAASVMPTSDHTVPPNRPATTSPTAASTQPQNSVHRRSPVRSDNQPNT